jgi:ribulose kinase
MSGTALIAVDVGTGSARTGVFAADGRMLGRAERPIALHRPLPDHAPSEHDETRLCSMTRRLRWSSVKEACLE